MTTGGKLLIIRHSTAMDRDAAARGQVPDAERPLTEKGIRRMRRAAAGLKVLVPALDVILASPRRRAVQSADLIGESFPDARRETLQALAPDGDPEAVLADRRRRPRSEWVAVVGHEPDLGLLASAALSGATRSFLPLKKGGCCLLTFDGQVRAGRGRLVWSLPPRVLRDLAKR